MMSQKRWNLFLTLGFHIIVTIVSTGDVHVDPRQQKM